MEQEATNGGGEVTTPEPGALQTEQTATQTPEAGSSPVKSDTDGAVGQQTTEQGGQGVRADARIRQLLDRVKELEETAASKDSELEALRNPQSNVTPSANAAAVYEQFPQLKGLQVEPDEYGNALVNYKGQWLNPEFASELIETRTKLTQSEIQQREAEVNRTRAEAQQTVMEVIKATREAAIPGLPEAKGTQADQFINMLANQYYAQQGFTDSSAETAEKCINYAVAQARELFGSLATAQTQDNSTAAATQPPPGKGGTSITSGDFSKLTPAQKKEYLAARDEEAFAAARNG
jgi:hypothetical protein